MYYYCNAMCDECKSTALQQQYYSRLVNYWYYSSLQIIIKDLMLNVQTLNTKVEMFAQEL